MGDLKEVLIVPNSPLRAARCESGSAGLAGSQSRVSHYPRVITQLILGHTYVTDIVPAVQSRRLVNLHEQPLSSSGTTLVVSYDPPDQGEQSAAGSAPGDWPFPLLVKDIALWCRFGTGDNSHTVEVDLAEGRVINLPGSVVEVGMLDYRMTRDDALIVIDEPHPAVEVHAIASASAEPHPRTAEKTERVMTWFTPSVDLTDPPNFDALLTALCNACRGRWLSVPA